MNGLFIGMKVSATHCADDPWRCIRYSAKHPFFFFLHHSVREISLLFLLHREGTELSKIKQFAWNHTAKSVKAGIRALICMVSKSLLHPLCCLKKWLKTIFSYIIKHTFLWSLVIHIRNKYFYMAHSFFPHSFAREQNVRHNLMS